MHSLQKKLKWLIPLLLLVATGIFYLKNQESIDSKKSLENSYIEEYEETEEDIAFESAMDDLDQAYPEVKLEDLSDIERKIYEQRMQKLKSSGFNFSTILKKSSSRKKYGGVIRYANDQIIGTWQTKLPVPTLNPNGKIGNGYRVNGSIYDADNDQMYAVSNPGHLYKVDKTGELQWTLLDHKRNYNKIFFGFNLPDGTFRMIKNEQPQGLIGHLSYSDDEGQTWTPANGALVQNNWAYNGFATTNDDNDLTKLFALGDHKNDTNTRTTYIFMSNDMGINFSESSLNFKTTDHQIQLIKTYHREQAYLFVRTKATNTITIYKYDDTVSDFQLLHTLPGTFTGFKRVVGTFSGGNVHFYIADTGKNIHYSSDEGATWTTTSTTNNRTFAAIHPDQPNMLFRGFLDVNLSTDFGATFNSFKHRLGWDLRHMTFHRKTDDTYFAFIGMDFGCFISNTAEDKDSYKHLNNGAPIALHYDAESNEQFNTIYMANQDKGSSAYLDTGEIVTTKGVAGTDVLRVTYAKGGESVWIWYYYGKIEHRFNFASPNYIDEKAPVNSGLGRWTSRNLIPSPDVTEDAVYGTWRNSLQKFSYANGVATKTTHPYDFGKELAGFGYSESNPNKWYVSAADGQFFYSLDGGTSFTATSYTGPVPKSGGGFRKGRHIIRVSKTNPNLVFYAGNSEHFLISRDGGITFTNHTNGLDIARIRDFAITDNDKFVFAACASAGPWVYSVDDDMWYKMDGIDIPRVDFTDVDYISNKKIARFATYGSGIRDFILNKTPALSSNPRGIKPKNLSHIKVFPNPANDYLAIHGIPKNAPVEIFDRNGTQVLNAKYNGRLNVSNLKRGMYMLKVNGSTTKRFIKN